MSKILNEYNQLLNYIHKNPLRANLCENETDYSYSSAKHCFEMKHYFHFLEPYEKQL